MQNEDFVIARAAFRAIDAQVERWQKLELSVAKSRMESLAKSLQDLPATTPPDNLILASSLATRMYTLCLERDEESLKSTMELCQQALERLGKGASEAAGAEGTERIASLSDTSFALTDEAAPEVAPGDGSQYTSDSEYTSTSQYDGDSGMIQGSDPISVPPPPLPPEMNPSTTQTDVLQVREPQLVDPRQPNALAIDGSQQLSSTGGRASLRLIASPVRNSQDSSTAGQRDGSVDSSGLVLPPVAEPVSSPISESSESLPQSEPSAKMLAGIDQLPIQELVRLLGSVQPKIAQAAALALRRHGMSESKLELAMELATGTEQRRLEIIDQFPSRTDIDPRVWLLWMAQDGQTEVRARAIAQLSSMLDQDVMRELRMLLNRERDPEVAQTIRRLLVQR